MTYYKKCTVQIYQYRRFMLKERVYSLKERNLCTHLAVGSPGQCTFCASRCPWSPWCPWSPLSSRFSDGSPGPRVSGTCHECHSHRTGRSQVIDINNWTPVSVTWNCVNSSSLSHVTVMCHWSKNITLSTTLSTRRSLKKMTSCNTVINKCPKYIFCCIMQATKNRWIGVGCRIQTKNWSETL